MLRGSLRNAGLNGAEANAALRGADFANALHGKNNTLARGTGGATKGVCHAPDDPLLRGGSGRGAGNARAGKFLAGALLFAAGELIGAPDIGSAESPPMNLIHSPPVMTILDYMDEVDDDIILSRMGL